MIHREGAGSEQKNVRASRVSARTAGINVRWYLAVRREHVEGRTAIFRTTAETAQKEAEYFRVCSAR
jgi:hypothetical protein